MYSPSKQRQCCCYKQLKTHKSSTVNLIFNVNHFHRLTTDEIETRINKMSILPALTTKGVDFVDKMSTYVYPSIEGTDYPRLLLYYSLLSGCGDAKLQGEINADSHVKLIKKFRTCAQGKLSFLNCQHSAII